MFQAKQLLRKLGEVVAPPRCLRCLREGTWLCQECVQLIAPYKNPMKNLRGLQVISAGPYRAPHFKRGIHWLKFKGVRDLAPILAAFLVPYLPRVAPMEQLREQAVIVPIPLHPRRERQRGFNQCMDLALALSEQTGMAVADILVRSKYTHAQAKLAPGELRRKNIKDAFALRGPLPEARYVLLLDDVTTTGSTLSVAADVLRAAGAREIWGVTVARG